MVQQQRQLFDEALLSARKTLEESRALLASFPVPLHGVHPSPLTLESVSLDTFPSRLQLLLRTGPAYEVLFSLNNDEGLDGWTTGGCCILAQALHSLYPSQTEVWYMLSADENVEHVLIKRIPTDTYVDAEGEYSKKTALSAYPTSVRFSKSAPNGLGDIVCSVQDVAAVREFLGLYLSSPFVVQRESDSDLVLWTKVESSSLPDYRRDGNSVTSSEVSTVVQQLLSTPPHYWLVKYGSATEDSDSEEGEEDSE